MIRAQVDVLQVIEERLAVLEAERAQLIAARDAFLSAGAVPYSGAGTSGGRGISRVQQVPPDQRVKVALGRDTPEGYIGTMELMLQTARKHPDLSRPELLDQASLYISPKTPIPRLNLRWALKYIVERRKVTVSKDGLVRVIEEQKDQKEKKTLQTSAL